MAPDPERGGALAPVEGALTAYMKEMRELNNENMPEVVCHEYSPFFDSRYVRRKRDSRPLHRNILLLLCNNKIVRFTLK